MKIQFDKNQAYQHDAIQAIVDIFEGQPHPDAAITMSYPSAASTMDWDVLAIGNSLLLSDDVLLTNVQQIQTRNDLPVTSQLQGRNFSIEMETGTGKTYVYLRTIYELHAKYGWKKFIIVVPSVAIREGVLQTIKLTHDHFAELYNNVPIDAWVYDSNQASRLRSYATSNELQVLIINIQAFDKKDIAIIHREHDRLAGFRPIQFIQATNPIVILDEPQNMESDNAQEAIKSLNPACTLRYSATHRQSYNLLYRLDPVKAYELQLVKRIEVNSVTAEAGFNDAYIVVKSITATKKKVTAALEIDIAGASGPKRNVIKVSSSGEDLYELSGQRDYYRGYVIANIDAGNQFIEFENGIIIAAGQGQGDHSEELMRLQIEWTIREHFEKELRIAKLPHGQRLKVLSLFFIDKVANYADDDGKIRQWFVHAYQKLATTDRFAPLNPLSVDQVHNGYFARDKTGFKDSNERRSTAADDEAYHLIMRDKERLLSFDEPLRFIFSHSALREGWDNPNVFQICTLNETRSATKKRQEIGRGLRLPVRENGERSFDNTINRLTIVANESYTDYAASLQRQMKEEWGVDFRDRVENARERHRLVLKKQWELDKDFNALWDKIKHHTRYQVNYDTDTLVAKSLEYLAQLPPLRRPQFFIRKDELMTTSRGIETALRSTSHREGVAVASALPNFIELIQHATELTRTTIVRILRDSGRLHDAHLNPQQLIEYTTSAIKKALNDLLVEGIKYEQIAGSAYDMMLFQSEEINAYLNRLVQVDKSIYDYVECDSQVERAFAELLEQREDILLFIKLPRWFKINTPLGTYNPDWAILKKEDNKRLYLVRETKGTNNMLDIGLSERQKILCGKAHFHELGVDFQVVKSATEI